MIPRDGIAHAVGSRFPTKRVLAVIRAAIERHRLDLSGLVVLTEAATGYYRVTPVIAGLARAARVIAVARDTSFGTSSDAQHQVGDLAEAAGVASRIDFASGAARDHVGAAQVVTNLGAVRPIDAAFAARMSPQGAVSLMFGALDARPADIDVAALRSAGIPVCGVDEERIGLFRWTGQRIAWWLTEVGLEIQGSRLAVWGDAPPARAVADWLARAGASIERIVVTPAPGQLDGLDGLVLMDREVRITPGERISPEVIAERSPGAAILEYAGLVDRARCAALDLVVYPDKSPVRGHVARTIGEILYAPVVELHTAGLRVGELMTRARAEGLDAAAAEGRARVDGPGEPVP
jgi:hypothetical protein